MFALELVNPKNFDTVISQFFNEPVFAGVQSWVPSADVVESQNELKICLDIPGLKAENVTIELPGDNTLVISGERKLEETEATQYHRKERFRGNFTRTFALPKTIDPAKITAEFHDGTLEVTLPKSEAAKPRKIEVQVK